MDTANKLSGVYEHTWLELLEILTTAMPTLAMKAGSQKVSQTPVEFSVCNSCMGAGQQQQLALQMAYPQN